MEPTFGKKLEEARTRKGISIRQASEALKIRPDFLLSFETDNGNFQMPDVYKRGFLKLYCKYLKIDADEILRNFHAYHSQIKAPTRLQQAGHREILGRMELHAIQQTSFELPPQVSEAQGTFQFGSICTETKPFQQQFLTQQVSQSQTNSTKENPQQDKESSFFYDSRKLYFKIGAIFAGTLTVFAIVAILVTNLVKSRSSLSSDSSDNSYVAASHVSGTNKPTPEQLVEQIMLNCEENIHVVVRQENDKKFLYSGNITPGNPITVAKKGPVKIHFSDGSKLLIQKADGKKLRPSRTGVGWIEI